MHALAACALAALLLAGCASDASSSRAARNGGQSIDWGDRERDTSLTTTLEFSSALSTGLPVAGNLLFDKGFVGPFMVPADQDTLKGVILWSCTSDPGCEMDFELRYGNNDLVTAVTGPSPQTFSIDAPAEGRWTLWAFTPPDAVAQTGVEGAAVLEFA